MVLAVHGGPGGHCSVPRHTAVQYHTALHADTELHGTVSGASHAWKRARVLLFSPLIGLIGVAVCAQRVDDYSILYQSR